MLFLDEPTTGLDPRSRLELWNVIRELVGRGTSLLLTTQYLEEADQLADRIVVIDRGRELAQGTASQLKATIGGERIEATVADTERLDEAVAVLSGVAVGDVEVDHAARTVLAPIDGGARTLSHALDQLDQRGVGLEDVGLRRPTLDDVFLTLTGHTTESDDEDQEVPA